MRTLGNRWRRMVAAIAAVVLLTACTATPEGEASDEVIGEAAEQPDRGDDEPSEASLDRYYDQELVWESCLAPGVECATASAPLDWSEPTGPSIELAVSRRPSTGDDEQRIGSLLVNLGGPGVPAVEWVAHASFPSRLGTHFDTVGFDPRGTGRSTAVDCGESSLRALLADLPLTSEDEATHEQARAGYREFGRACLEGTGELLGHVDTASMARDLDLLRALLGDEQLHYLGYSYGAFLGATYAELFPDRVGRLVLDSAVSFSEPDHERALSGYEEIEGALRDFVERCQDRTDCPVTGDIDDGVAQVAAMIAAREDAPLELDDGRRVTGSTAAREVSDVLTAGDWGWPRLTRLLAGWDDAAQWAAHLDDAEADYPEQWAMAGQAILCLDHPVVAHDPASVGEFDRELEARAPTIRRLLGPSSLAAPSLCEQWPVGPVREPAPFSASGAAPILVVGVTGDRRTPYDMSVALADELESGVLLTWEGDRHGAYGAANTCLHAAVDAYLIDGTLPDDGTVC